MKLFKILNSALKYANYDFYNLKSEIVKLVQTGRKNGLNNPDYCKLTIKNSAKRIDYPVNIDLYYKTNDNEAMHLPSELLIGSFNTMPCTIKSALESRGFLEIRVENLLELAVSAGETVSKPIKFSSISDFNPQKAFTGRTLTIKDELFSFRVVFSYTTPDGQTVSRAVVYADIVDMPSDVLAKLQNDGVCVLKID